MIRAFDTLDAVVVDKLFQMSREAEQRAAICECATCKAELRAFRAWVATIGFPAWVATIGEEE